MPANADFGSAETVPSLDFLGPFSPELITPMLLFIEACRVATTLPVPAYGPVTIESLMDFLTP